MKEMMSMSRMITVREWQARRLTDDVNSGRVVFKGSTNKYPHFPGENEKTDHKTYIAFLSSRTGKACIEGMKRQDVRYRI